MKDLSEYQIGRIATLLRINLDDPRLDQVLAVINDALRAQWISDQIYSDYQNASTRGNSLYEQSQTIIKALQTIQKTLSKMPESAEILLDDHYYFSNKNSDMVRRSAIKPTPEELRLDGLAQQNPKFNGSGFAVLIDRLLNAATSAANDVIHHGKGKGKLARDYQPALKRLADGLEPLFSELSIESRKNSAFYRLCDFFLNDVLTTPAGITEIQRQINNLIQARNGTQRK